MVGIVTDQNFKKGASVVLSDYCDRGSDRYQRGKGRTGKLYTKTSEVVCNVQWDDDVIEAYYMKELQFVFTIDNVYDSISDSIRNILIGLDKLEKKVKPAIRK
jgi:hypothetical protein